MHLTDVTTYEANTELLGEIDEILIHGDSNTSLSVVDHSNRQKISKDRVELRNTKGQLHLIDTYSPSSNNSRLHILLKLQWNMY